MQNVSFSMRISDLEKFNAGAILRSLNAFTGRYRKLIGPLLISCGFCLNPIYAMGGTKCSELLALVGVIPI